MVLCLCFYEEAAARHEAEAGRDEEREEQSCGMSHFVAVRMRRVGCSPGENKESEVGFVRLTLWLGGGVRGSIPIYL